MFLGAKKLSKGCGIRSWPFAARHAGLVPAIHVLSLLCAKDVDGWSCQKITL
jgi:hypothetical protein